MIDKKVDKDAVNDFVWSLCQLRLITAKEWWKMRFSEGNIWATKKYDEGHIWATKKHDE